MKSHGTTIALTLFLAAISMGNVAWGAGERDFEPSFGHREECTPVRTVTGLRQQVRWWARDGAPVALGAQISDGSDAPASSVAWRLVVTTFDREVVDERHGVSPLREGNGFATVTFDGRDSAGHPFAPGHYAYRFEVEGFEGSGGLLDVYASDEVPPAPVDDVREPLAASLNPSVPYNYYFGAQHAHTAYSDGGIPLGGASCASVSSPHAGAKPADAYAYAKANGMVDWICVIDHNHLFDDACSGCSTTTLQNEYHDGVNAAAAATTSTFVGIYGMEWGVIGDSTTHTGHVALYDVTKLFGWETYAEVTTGKNDYLGLWTATDTAANAGASGAVASLCHAHTYDFQSWAKNAAGLNVVRGVAVISGPYDQKGETFADGGGRYAGPSVGTDLYQYALQRGWTVGPESHADNHCANYGTATRNRTVVLASSLSKASVIGALKARRFYASSDLNTQLFFGTSDYAHPMGDIFTTSAATANLLLWVKDPDGATVSTVTLYQGNPAAGSGSPTTLTMTNQGAGTYTATVNVTTSQAYWYAYATLSNGAELWSAPVWITKTSGCADTTAPTATITAPSGSTVTGTVTVTATGSDNVGVTSMTLKIDGATVATSASGSVSYSWNTSGLTAGSSHSITATSSDACGNVSPTASKSVTIGTTGGDTPLTSGVTLTGQSVTLNAWKYYYITVPAGATNLTLATTSASADVDIYTQFGAKPTLSTYACAPYTGSGNESCSAANPAAGTWWLGVYGYAAATFSVTGTVTTGSGPTTLFSNSFETTSVWNNAVVVSAATNGAWSMVSSGTNPTVTPHSGSQLAKFNSYDATSGAQTRYYRSSGFSVASTYTTVTLTFWMYHDTGYSTSADKVQAQVSTNGGTSFTSVGTAVNRYDGSTGWKQHTVDLSAYKGTTVTLGFLGTSAYGNNVFLDDVTVTAQ